jgi:hypothetical protein
MKKLLLLLSVFFAIGAAAQNNDYLVTWNGIGPLRIGMSKADVEKILGKKLTLKNLLNKDEGYADTLKVKYKNADLQIYFEKQYVDENNYDIVLQGMRTSSPLCKTKIGIGIGDDKMKIINAYEYNTLYLSQEFEDDTYTKRSKTRSMISIYSDDSGNSIVLYLVNKKVVTIEVTYSEAD